MARQNKNDEGLSFRVHDSPFEQTTTRVSPFSVNVQYTQQWLLCLQEKLASEGAEGGRPRKSATTGSRAPAPNSTGVALRQAHMHIRRRRHGRMAHGARSVAVKTNLRRNHGDRDGLTLRAEHKDTSQLKQFKRNNCFTGKFHFNPIVTTLSTRIVQSAFHFGWKLSNVSKWCAVRCPSTTQSGPPKGPRFATWPEDRC
jgi:hypothetical protein